MIQLDHIVVTTRRLDDAVAAWQKLGFQLTERGFHPYGTMNNLVMLGSTYIELIALGDPAAWERAMEAKMLSEDGSAVTWEALQTRDGPSLWAITSDDLDADLTRISSAGVQVRSPDRFKRPVVLPDGRETAADITINYLGYIPGAAGVPIFVCVQANREAVWVPEWQRHPNGATEVVGITYLAARPPELVPYLSGILGAPGAGHSDESIEFDAGPARVRVLTPARCRERFAALTDEDFPAGPSLEAITVAVRELSAARACLEESGVAFVEPADGVLQFGRRETLGTIVELVEEG